MIQVYDYNKSSIIQYDEDEQKREYNSETGKSIFSCKC